MIRVLYVLHDTSVFSGAAKAFLAILSGLRDKDIKPIVALPNRCGIYDVLKEKGIETIVVPIRYATYPRVRSLKESMLYFIYLLYWQFSNFLAVRKLIAKLKDNKPDIIHSNVSVIDVGLRVALKLGIPHIYHFREYADKDFGFKYFPSSKRFHERVRKADSYSISITNDIRSYHNLQGERNKVIYDGVFHASSEMPSTTFGRYFLYAGRIEPAKGLLSLLRAYKEYSDSVSSPYPLHVAGEMPKTEYAKKVKTFVEENSIGNLVVFMGQCTNMNELYGNARALIVPSLFEGFGFCMSEAMSQGCLVIGHDTGGTHEQFNNGLRIEGVEIGIRYSNEAELTDALINVHPSSENSYKDMKRSAFRVVNSLYSIEAVNLQLYSFYNQIVRKIL
jgi:glycosyltransferase involved in cell wall biosynthesis